MAAGRWLAAAGVVLIGALVWSRAATAQQPQAAPLPTTPEPPAATTEPPAAEEAPSGWEPPGWEPQSEPWPGEVRERKLRLSAGGLLLYSSDAIEGSGNRGGLLASIGFRPVKGLEIAGQYENAMGDWTTLSVNPSLTGSGPAQATAGEYYHRGDLGVRYDLRFGPHKRIHVAPYLGGAFLSLTSSAFQSSGFGGGGGLQARFDLTRLAFIDAGGTAVRAISPSGGGTALLGPIEGVWTWNVGLALGASPWSRLHVAYVGEALDRLHSTRWSHGLLLSLDVEVLH